VTCYRTAAVKNDGRGQLNLGRMYQDGSGVKCDLAEAYEWFYLASKNGEPMANHYLMALTGRDPLNGTPLLTAEQIETALRRALEFQQNFAGKRMP